MTKMDKFDNIKKLKHILQKYMRQKVTIHITQTPKSYYERNPQPRTVGQRYEDSVIDEEK